MADPKVVATYQKTWTRDTGITSPATESTTLALGTAPLAGDVVLLLVGNRTVTNGVAFRNDATDGWLVNSADISGCGLGQWENLYWIKSIATLPAGLADTSARVSQTTNEASITAYAVRATGSATSGNLTFSWPGKNMSSPPGADASFTVLVIRGLPSTARVSYLLPRADLSGGGVINPAFTASRFTASLPLPRANTWANSGSGPGSSTGYPVGRGQVAVMAFVGSSGNGLLVPYDKVPAVPWDATDWTALNTLNLGVFNPGDSYAAARIAYATPGVAAGYGSGIDTVARDQLSYAGVFISLGTALDDAKPTLPGTGSLTVNAKVYGGIVPRFTASSSLRAPFVMKPAPLAGTGTLSVALQNKIAPTFAGSATLAATVATPLGTIPSPTGTSDLTLSTLTRVVMADMDFPGTSSLSCRIPRPLVVEPTTGREPYRVRVVDFTGQRYAELENATIGQTIWDLNALGSLDFALPADDPKIAECRVTEREVQVWKGTECIFWGVIVKARGDHQSVTFQCASLEWYFTRRYMGKVPPTNLLKNGSFEEGERYWTFTYAPGSIPAVPPQHAVTTTTLSGKKAITLTGASTSVSSSKTISADVNFALDSDTLTAAGIAEINALCAPLSATPTMRVDGHADSTGTTAYNYDLSLRRANSVKAQILTQRPGAVVSVYAWGETRPVASNATEAGRAANRRVEIAYASTQLAKGHRQYMAQRVAFTNPKAAKKAKTLTLVGWCRITDFNAAAKDNWGIYLQFTTAADMTKVKGFSAVPISADTPRNRWVRMECSVTVPADDVAYVLEARAYPPDGTMIVDEMGLTASDQLAFFDVDEALIVKGLAQHAQDPAMGKSTLNIDTDTPLTGVKRTREYPFVERGQIWDKMAEFPTLANGVDMAVEWNGNVRTLRTFYPRKGSNKGVHLVLGSNLASFSVDYDGDQTSSQIIVQAEGEGSDREEGVATDLTVLSTGMVLEKVYNATPGSSVSSLTAQAQRGLERYRHPVVIPSVTAMPEYTAELLDNVRTGDVVQVEIEKGWIQTDAPYRVTRITLDPTTDQLTFNIVPFEGF